LLGKDIAEKMEDSIVQYLKNQPNNQIDRKSLCKAVTDQVKATIASKNDRKLAFVSTFDKLISTGLIIVSKDEIVTLVSNDAKSSKKRKIDIIQSDFDVPIKDLCDATICALRQHPQHIMGRKSLRKVVMKPHNLDKEQAKSIFEKALEDLESSKQITVDIDDNVTLKELSIEKPNPVSQKTQESIVISTPAKSTPSVTNSATKTAPQAILPPTTPSSAVKNKIMAPSRQEDRAKIVILRPQVQEPPPTQRTPLAKCSTTTTPNARQASTTTPAKTSTTCAKKATLTPFKDLVKGSMSATILQVLARRPYPDSRTLRDSVLEEHSDSSGDRDAIWSEFRRALSALTKDGRVSQEGGSIRVGSGLSSSGALNWTIDEVISNTFRSFIHGKFINLCYDIVCR
jgi:hypothetical protein